VTHPSPFDKLRTGQAQGERVERAQGKRDGAAPTFGFIKTIPKLQNSYFEMVQFILLINPNTVLLPTHS